MSRGALLGAVLVLCGCASGGVATRQDPWPREQVLVREDRAHTFAAWREFCQRYPGECAPREGAPVIPWGVAARVNERVNAEIRWVDDSTDRWDVLPVGGGDGDCEEYALTKRARLREMGYGSESMSLGLVALDDGPIEHVVLLVHTEYGVVSLDSAYVKPVPISRSRWTLVDVEVAGLWRPVTAIQAGNTLLAPRPSARGETKVAESQAR